MRTLRETPPDGLLPWVLEQADIYWENYLIYRAGKLRNPLTEQNEKCVDGYCTACGQSMKLEYIAGPACAGYASAPFGFGWHDDAGAHESISWRDLNCPCCGEKVTAMHIGAMSHGRSRYAWVMQPEADGEALLLYFWRVQRMVTKAGEILWSVDPWEAYAFDKAGHKYFSRWRQVISATSIMDHWEQRQVFKDAIYDIDIVYCPEGIGRIALGTAMENSKLELYMQQKKEFRFPVTWLWLYQKHPNIENLMTASTAGLATKLIRMEKEEQLSYQQRSRFNTKCDLLRDLDWKAVRPWDILRIQKDEMAYFQNISSSEKHLAALILARKGGLSVKPGQEKTEWLLGYEAIFCRKGIDPEKVKRYIARQKRKYPKDYCSESGILDFWKMAKKLKWKLKDPAIMWPQHFKQKHDEAMEAWRVLQDEEKKKQAAVRAAKMLEQFTRRYERMKRYSWEKDGILIRPARDEGELITEGTTLSHCVATYAKRHAAGELTIFFIRRVSAPDTPWFTLNFNEKTLSVTENRGKHNCSRTKEVQKFEKEWIAWVREAFGQADKKHKEVTAA